LEQCFSFGKFQPSSQKKHGIFLGVFSVNSKNSTKDGQDCQSANTKDWQHKKDPTQEVLKSLV